MSTTSNNASYRLTVEELRRFHEQGFIGPFTLYSKEEIREILKNKRVELFDRSKAVYQDVDATSGVSIANYDRHLDVGFLADHVCRPEIVARVSSILGPDVLCWRSEFFPKYPGDEGTDWHQADTFAHASGVPQLIWPKATDFGGTITAWTAFTPTDVETACLEFIPGTHRTMYYDEKKGMHYDPSAVNAREKEGIKRGFLGYDYRALQKDPEWKPDESKAVSIVMNEGEFVLFWSTLMHASHPHRGKTKQMRLGFGARYVPTCVKIYPDTDRLNEFGASISLENYGAVLVCGKDEFEHNRIAAQTTRGKPFTICQTS